MARKEGRPVTVYDNEYGIYFKVVPWSIADLKAENGVRHIQNDDWKKKAKFYLKSLDRLLNDISFTEK